MNPWAKWSVGLLVGYLIAIGAMYFMLGKH